MRDIVSSAPPSTLLLLLRLLAVRNESIGEAARVAWLGGRAAAAIEIYKDGPFRREA